MGNLLRRVDRVDARVRSERFYPGRTAGRGLSVALQPDARISREDPHGSPICSRPHYPARTDRASPQPDRVPRRPTAAARDERGVRRSDPPVGVPEVGGGRLSGRRGVTLLARGGARASRDRLSTDAHSRSSDAASPAKASACSYIRAGAASAEGTDSPEASRPNPAPLDTRQPPALPPSAEWPGRSAARSALPPLPAGSGQGRGSSPAPQSSSVGGQTGARPRNASAMNATTASTRNRKNRIFAASNAKPARIPKLNSEAIRAITRNTSARRSMALLPGW